MPIDRKNSFHLLLSDDELTLLRLLSEREGLNSSDYLRTMLRRQAGTPPHVAAWMRVGGMFTGEGGLAKAAPKAASPRKPKKAR